MVEKIAVIGLGYVGLPLAVAFSAKYEVIGYDINQRRIEELLSGFDSTGELSSEDLNLTNKSTNRSLVLTNELSQIASCTIYIVTVPTPTDTKNRPDLSPLYESSKTVGNCLSKGNIVIYESTVYPGVTEEECVPVLENGSGLKFNQDFFVGYSPERINPGDKVHTVTNILKLTSGSTPEVAEKVDQLYKSVITAGTFKASSIKVAEAAKVIENSQRDINIAFVNELSKIFNLLKIDTAEVLEAAGTKWNFLPFKPGLVGGHCIGVDPYYLAQKAQEVGYNPEIILSGRRINDGMGEYVASRVVKELVKKDIQIKGAKVCVLGITFKENCPDIRNTKVLDVVTELKSYGTAVEVFDPLVDKNEVRKEYGLQLVDELSNDYSAVVLAVAHNEFMKLDLNSIRKDNSVLYDVKSVLPKDQVDARL